MDNKEINIKSSTIEKGLELAKEFLGKLIGPTIEEIGLLVADNIKYLRFKNQVKILLKAREHVAKRNLNLKELPVKILVPLLEQSSLEENEELQEKWANMLTNMVDSEQNLQNQIFPYLLGQISIEEYSQLKQLAEDEKQYARDREDYRKKSEDFGFRNSKEGREMKKDIDEKDQRGLWIDLEEYERANLIRLGLIRELPPSIYVHEFQTGGYEEGAKWHRLKAGYEHGDFGYRMTELGERFLDICELREKGSKN